jgi:DNA repair protein RecO (recombination protein O)
MKGFDDTAIVLSRRDLGEADRVLTLLTKRHGKVSAVVKGAKKPTSRLSAGGDLFSTCRIRLIGGKGEMYVLIGSEREGAPLTISDLSTMTALSSIAEAIDRMTETAQPLDNDVFPFVERCLKEASQSPQAQKVVVFFIQRLLWHMGVGLQVFECVECGEALQPQGAAIDVEEGGALCQNCLTSSSRRISLNALKCLRLLARSEEETFFKLNLQASELNELVGLSVEQIQSHSGRRLVALPTLLGV